MKRTGVAFWGGMPIEGLIECVRLADERGFHSAWVIESYVDVFSILSACAIKTKSIQLATGVATIFTRNPTVLGVAAGTLDAISNGRFVLGLGVGHQEIHVVRDNPDGGSVFTNPRQRLRETVDIVRLILKSASAGEAVDYYGTVFQITGYEPWFNPYRDEIPIYLASLTQRTTELAGEIADGVIPIFYPSTRIRELRKQVNEGATKANREFSSVDMSCYIPVCVSDDIKQGYSALRYLVSSHIANYRFYQNYFRNTGFAGQVAGIMDANKRRDLEAAASLVADEMIDAIGVCGSVDKCSKKVEEFRESGSTLPILYLVHPEFKGYRMDRKAMHGIASAIQSWPLT